MASNQNDVLVITDVPLSELYSNSMALINTCIHNASSAFDVKCFTLYLDHTNI